ncbi:MAG TPA: hypothetical protein VFB21_10230 [Chthonomonadaceae bacterium]|nr:hypothetical protein [Chthonomonadaceae bacterium]
MRFRSRSPYRHLLCPSARPSRRAEASRHASSVCACKSLLLALLGLALCAPARLAAAQESALLGAGPVLGSANSLPLASAPQGAAVQSDVIFGRNSPGPYPLTWKGIRAGSEEVWRDGVHLRRDDDYTLDAAAGTLAFTTPLRGDQIVRVTYRYDTPDAAPNKTAILMPLQLDLWRQGKNRLSFGTQYRLDKNGQEDKAGSFSALQFVGGARLLPGSELSSGLFLDVGNGDLLSRSGLRLAEQTKLRYANFGVSYTRAGAQFAQGSVSGLKAGNEILEANGQLTLMPNLTLSALMRQTTELLPPTASAPAADGVTTREFTQSLDFALPKDGGKLQAARTQTVIAPPDSDSVTRTTDTVSLERALAKGTLATARYEALTTTPDGEDKSGASYEQKTSFGLTSRPLDRLSLTGTFQNRIGTPGAEDKVGLRVETNPFARLRDLKFAFGWNDTFDPDGVRRSREALVTLPTFGFAAAKLSGGVRTTSAPGQEQLVGLVDGALRPLRYLEVSGGARLRSGTALTTPAPVDAVDTYNVKLALAPWKRLRLTGSLAVNPENSDGTIKPLESQKVGVETELGIWQLRGQYGIEEEYLATRRLNTLELALGLRLSRFDTLTTGYKSSAIFDTGLSAAREYTLSYARRLGAAFDLLLGSTVTLYDSENGTQWDKTDVKAEAKLNIRF